MVNEKDSEFGDVKSLSIEKTDGGHAMTVNGRVIQLPGASNFEWRMEGNVAVKHMYMGNETGKETEWKMNIEFMKPCHVRIQQPDPRCYVYVKGE